MFSNVFISLYNHYPTSFRQFKQNHVHKRMRPNMYACKHMSSLAHMQAHTRACTYARAHAQASICTYAHTQTPPPPPPTHTHTHTHTTTTAPAIPRAPLTHTHTIIHKQGHNNTQTHPLLHTLLAPLTKIQVENINMVLYTFYLKEFKTMLLLKPKLLNI